MKRVSFTAGLVVAGLLFAAQANARDGQALVQSISGEVKLLDGSKWLPLQTGQLLKTGAVVKTGAKSRADLFLGVNGSMLRLAANTELKFSRLAVEISPIEPIAKTEMELRSGRVIGNVRKLPMGSSYVIKTPVGVADIKGTVYDINTNGELIVLSGKVKYTDRTNGREVLIAAGEKYVGGREVKAAEDEKAEAAAAASNGSSFTIGVPLRQGVWENQPNNQKAGPIDPTQFIPPRFYFIASAEMTATVGTDGRIKSIDILTGGFTENEIEEHFDSIKAEYGKADNYEVGGNKLNADEVDIDVSKVPTGDGLFRIKTTVKRKDPEGDFGQAGDSIAVKTVNLNLPGASVDVIGVPVISPIKG